MAKRTGFKNIQIQGKSELAELFEDSYEQSGTNSKAEFLNVLLETYLNPVDQESGKVKNLLTEKEEIEKQSVSLENGLTEAQSQIQTLKARLEKYETEFLKKLLEKHKGKTLKFRNPKGERVQITINDLPDVNQAIINSFQA